MVEGRRQAFTSLYSYIDSTGWRRAVTAQALTLAESTKRGQSTQCRIRPRHKHVKQPRGLKGIHTAKSTVSIYVLLYISKYRLPSARYHGLRMRQNLVQWIPQIERHMTCVDQAEGSKA